MARKARRPAKRSARVAKAERPTPSSSTSTATALPPDRNPITPSEPVVIDAARPGALNVGGMPRDTFADHAFDQARIVAVNPTETVGGGGTAIYAGYPVSPEKDPELFGTTKYKTFSNVIHNLCVIATCIRYILALAAKPDWSCEP